MSRQGTDSIYESTGRAALNVGRIAYHTMDAIGLLEYTPTVWIIGIGAAVAVGILATPVVIEWIVQWAPWLYPPVFP